MIVRIFQITVSHNEVGQNKNMFAFAQKSFKILKNFAKHATYCVTGSEKCLENHTVLFREISQKCEISHISAKIVSFSEISQHRPSKIRQNIKQTFKQLRESMLKRYCASIMSFCFERLYFSYLLMRCCA